MITLDDLLVRYAVEKDNAISIPLSEMGDDVIISPDVFESTYTKEFDVHRHYINEERDDMDSYPTGETYEKQFYVEEIYVMKSEMIFRIEWEN